jgi:hypothetical protein
VQKEGHDHEAEDYQGSAQQHPVADASRCVHVGDDGSTFRTSRSAIEDVPAHLVTQPLVVQHEFSYLAGKLCPLPPALQASSLLSLSFRSRRACSPDRVSRRTQVMSRHVGYRHGLSGGKSHLLCSPRRLPGRRVSEGGRAGLRHRDLTPPPGTRQFDRAARPVVIGVRELEVVQHMLGAIGRPESEAVMIGVP